MSKKEKALSLLVSLLLAAAVAVGGGMITAGAVPEWYAGLDKPFWTPPNWLFGPVWTALYAAMALASWRIYLLGGFRCNRRELSLYLVQLALNGIWTPLFFGLRSPGLAFLEIMLLWGFLVAVVVGFWRKSRLAGWLMLPYILWVSFAAALNFAVWRMN